MDIGTWTDGQGCGRTDGYRYMGIKTDGGTGTDRQRDRDRYRYGRYTVPATLYIAWVWGDRQTDIGTWMDRWTHGQMDGQTYRYADGWT